jgi:glycosyltransferase involved in cell wall biosynthesis
MAACALDDVSVIVPTKDERAHLPAFLSSLPAAVELVVVDASRDGTDRLAEELRPSRTRVIRSSCGIAAARQIGARAARGRVLLFSDVDVRFEPGYWDALPRVLDAEAFYGPKRTTADYARYGRVFEAAQSVLHRLGVPAASGSNMAVRRDVFDAVGGFRQDLPVNEDTELMMRVARRGYRVLWRPELAVRSLDDRRLRAGVVFKSAHSLTRGLLLLADHRLGLPRRWLAHDWGYWRRGRAGLARPLPPEAR